MIRQPDTLITEDIADGFPRDFSLPELSFMLTLIHKEISVGGWEGQYYDKLLKMSGKISYFTREGN